MMAMAPLIITRSCPCPSRQPFGVSAVSVIAKGRGDFRFFVKFIEQVVPTDSAAAEAGRMDARCDYHPS